MKLLKYLTLVLGLLLFANGVWAATWYVRPAPGEYGAEDGTTYDTAWDSMSAVVWGVSGVNTGDTLKLCGAFVAADKDSSKGGAAMLSVEYPGVIVDGDCSEYGDLAKAVLNGEGSVAYGLYCDTAAECQDQQWRNFASNNMTTRGYNVRNSLDDVDVVNFRGTNLSCTDIIGAEVSAPWCVAGWGATATLTGIASLRSTDDGVHWQGDDFTISDWDIRFPGWNIASGSNIGDCVQVITRTDRAKITRGYCDKRNANADGNASKSCAIVGDPASGTSSEISHIKCDLPTTGNAVFESKSILTSGAGAWIQHNEVRGGHYGIFAFGGSGTRIESNIITDSQLEAIAVPTTTTTGTTSIDNNVAARAPKCFILKGASGAATVQARNNIAVDCPIGFEGFQATRVLAANRCSGATTCSNNAGSPAPTSVDAKFLGGPSPTTTEGFIPYPDSSLCNAGAYVGKINAYDGKPVDILDPSIGAYDCNSLYRQDINIRNF